MNASPVGYQSGPWRPFLAWGTTPHYEFAVGIYLRPRTIMVGIRFWHWALRGGIQGWIAEPSPQ